jgi:hypothetical protein
MTLRAVGAIVIAMMCQTIPADARQVWGGNPCEDVSAAELSEAQREVEAHRHVLKDRGFTDREIDQAVRWAAIELGCQSGPSTSSTAGSASGTTGAAASEAGSSTASASSGPNSSAVSTSSRIWAAVESYGRLLIESQPSEASVQVDGRTFRERTATRGFVPSGYRRFRLSLPGYAPAEGLCDVKKGRVNGVLATFGKASSSLTCTAR